MYLIKLLSSVFPYILAKLDLNTSKINYCRPKMSEKSAQIALFLKTLPMGHSVFCGYTCGVSSHLAIAEFVESAIFWGGLSPK